MKVGSATSNLLAVPREPAKADKTAKTTGAGEAKPVPPGLERAQARLQSLTSPNAGQATALDRISRNIARYTQTQAIVETPTTPPAASTDTAVDALTAASAPIVESVAAEPDPAETVPAQPAVV